MPRPAPRNDGRPKADRTGVDAKGALCDSRAGGAAYFTDGDHRNQRIAIAETADGDRGSDGDGEVDLLVGFGLLVFALGRSFQHQLMGVASHLAMRDVSIKTIQELLGHANLKMIMRYAHLMPEVRRDAVLLLDQPAPVGGKDAAPKPRKLRGKTAPHDVPDHAPEDEGSSALRG